MTLSIFPQDMGCGVGGPARYIAKGVGCDVIGVNISSYQLERCRLLTEKEKLTEKVAFVQVRLVVNST